MKQKITIDGKMIKQSKILEFGIKIPDQVYSQRPGAYAVLLREDGYIGIVSNPRGYFLLGGGIDGNEYPEEALHREVKEEIGGKIKIISKIGEAIEHHFAKELNQYFSKHGYFYKAALLKIGKGESDHELQWHSLQDTLAKLALESQKWAVSQLLL